MTPWKLQERQALGAWVLRRRLSRWRGPFAMRLNITAMLDVMLQLLIFLLATAGLALEEGMLPTRLPSDAVKASASQQPLVIAVAAAGEGGYRLTVAGESTPPSDFRGLCALLQQQSDRYPKDHPLIIQAQGPVRWQHVVNALNAAVRAGYSNVQLADAPSAPPEEVEAP